MATEAEINAAMQQGIEVVTHHLDAVAPRTEKALMLAYAAGIASGVAEWLLEAEDTKCAFDLFTEIADDIINPTFSKDPK